MKLFVKLLMLIGVLTLTACANQNTEYTYPKSRADERSEEVGKITEQGGLLDYFGDSSKKRKGAYIGVNSYLWRASLDVISFIPIATADPFGGVIITDWYEDPSAPNERFKANIIIMSSNLQADAVKVKIFRQAKDKHGNWNDLTPNLKLGEEFENLILTKARHLKIQNIRQ